MTGLARRVTAAAVTASLVVLVVCDLSIGSFQAWWDRHSLTASIVSSLLVLAVTALIVDEVVARRQRKARATSVAVQALIVYGQGRRTWNAVKSSAADGKGGGNGAGSALEEWRALANMLLTASPALFEDPEARRFLEEVERFSGLILSKFRRSDGTVADDDRQHLEAEFSNGRAGGGPAHGEVADGGRVALRRPGLTLTPSDHPGRSAVSAATQSARLTARFFRWT